MRATAIMYHDVVSPSDNAASGFADAGANRYKLEVLQFASHLRALEMGCIDCSRSVLDVDFSCGEKFVLLTFDDGGSSAYTHAAPLLEAHKWRGHFFVATDYVDSPGFLSSGEIRELKERGHIVGSHSASHPLRMAACGWCEILREWEASVRKLSDILGERVVVASVPGGMYSDTVANAASQVGIRVLFTSEPTTRVWRVAGTTCLGRYTVQRQTSARVIAAIAEGVLWPWLHQYLIWNAKKLSKLVGGERYMKARRWLLEP